MRWLLSLILSVAFNAYGLSNDIQTLMAQAQERGQSQLFSTHRQAPLTTPAVLFVSFSMPEQSLKAYLVDAQKAGIPVVIRGLVHDSVRETIAKTQPLLAHEQEGGIQINPKLFDQYHITKVPTLVVFANPCTHPCQKFDAMTGNIGLGEALKAMIIHGQYPQQAKVLMRTLEPYHG